MRSLRTTDRAARRTSGARGVPTVVVSTAQPLAHQEAVSAGEWRRKAACLDSAPETFFPLAYRKEELVRPARRICGRCPVRATCLADVMATEDPARRWGVYGGTTPQERTALNRAGLTVAPAPTFGGAA